MGSQSCLKYLDSHYIFTCLHRTDESNAHCFPAPGLQLLQNLPCRKLQVPEAAISNVCYSKLISSG